MTRTRAEWFIVENIDGPDMNELLNLLPAHVREVDHTGRSIEQLLAEAYDQAEYLGQEGVCADNLRVIRDQAAKVTKSLDSWIKENDHTPTKGGR